MGRFKILIVSATFYPENSPRSFRTTELAKEIARQGHEVVVYIPFRGNDYNEFAREHNLIMKDLGKLRCQSIKLKGGKLGKSLRRLLRRAMTLFLEYPYIELMFKIAKQLRKEDNYDMLISIAVPFSVHWGVAKVRKKNHRIADTWVADCGDPFMGKQTDSFRRPFYFKYVEKWFSRKCDYLAVPFEALKEKFYPEFHDKMLVIPQGFRVEDIKLADKVDNPVPTFAFSGSIIPGIRDLDLFFKILKDINHKFKFYIFTSQPEYFKPFKNYFGDSLEISSYVPRLELLYELSKCDFLVNVDTIYDGQSLNAAFPSKLIDYSFTKRPILNICSNSIDRKVVLQFLDGNYINAREVDSDKYRIENVTASFLSLIKSD